MVVSSTNNHGTVADCFNKRCQQPTLSIKQQLLRIGVEVLEPETRQQELLAQAMADFATFCLHDEQPVCRAIIDKHMMFAESGENSSSSIGELQGGSDEFDIYRLSLPPPPQHHYDDKCSSNSSSDDNNYDDANNAAMELLQAFVTSQAGKEYRNVLTFESMRRYILEMCERRLNTRRRQRQGHHSSSCKPDDDHNYATTATITRLVNVMLILAFGPTHGQPRHIDHMHPNLSIFLFMSEHCPSTIIYDTTMTTSNTSTTTTIAITNTQQLVQYWQEQCEVAVPTLLQTMLNRHGGTKLHSNAAMPYLEHFGSWDTTIDTMLQYFGKLYQSITARPLSLPTTRPGTTLIVGGVGDDENNHYATGNHVHAGPPTLGPRMLCFAVGILKEDDSDDDDDDNILADDEEEEGEDANFNKKENDGEIQYNPVLFHADLCCILFTIMDHYYDNDNCQPDDDDDADDNNDETYQSKWFLLHDVLVPMVKGLCHDHIVYERLLGNERHDLCDWLQRLTVVLVENDHSLVQVQGLVQEAIASKCIFYCSCPDSLVNKTNKKMARRKNKQARRPGKKQTRGQGKKAGDTLVNASIH